MNQNETSDQLIRCHPIKNEFSGDLEILILENDKIRIKILADRGADLISFVSKDRDFDIAWRTSTGLPTKKVARDHPADIDTFMNGYPGGWQTIFPNGGAPSAHNGISYGQHDEVAVLPWERKVITENGDEVSIEFKVLTPKSPFEVIKTFTIKKGESICYVKEQIRNLSESTWEAMWGFHFTFGEPFIDEKSYIVLEDNPTVMPHESERGTERRMGSTKEFIWPMGRDENNNEVDFSRLPKKRTNGEMLYLRDLTTGQYQIVSPTFSAAVKVSWDKEVFPYLWYWQEYGASLEAPWFGKHYNIGLEPFSSYPTSGIADAVKNGSTLKINGGEVKKNFYTVEILAN